MVRKKAREIQKMGTNISLGLLSKRPIFVFATMNTLNAIIKKNPQKQNELLRLKL